ncbi:MAG: DUF4238 domain-containing protein [Acidobacteria bacterium]|nr:DUF4238 domain-containing protein [Acidobacteriota bacterium]
MAGSRQHVLPQFLLRGFASRTSAKEAYSWVQRKRVVAFETNITNIGVTKHFYDQNGGETSVDQEITALENRFAPLLWQLREEQLSRGIPGSPISEFVVHLTLRTKHLRDSLSEAVAYGIRSLTDFMSRPENLRSILRRSILRNSRVFRESVVGQLKQQGLTRAQINTAFPYMRDLILSQLDTSIDDGTTAAMAHFRNIALEALSQSAKSGHIRALMKGLIPESRLALFDGFQWRLIVFDEPSLVVGDAGPITNTEMRFKTVPDEDDHILGVCLPIGARHLIVGCSSTPLDNADPGTLNLVQATRAREFVVGPTKEVVEKYATEIGKEGFFLSQEQLERLLEEVLRGL